MEKKYDDSAPVVSTDSDLKTVFWGAFAKLGKANLTS
jgi:hypothetical protein